MFIEEYSKPEVQLFLTKSARLGTFTPWYDLRSYYFVTSEDDNQTRDNVIRSLRLCFSYEDDEIPTDLCDLFLLEKVLAKEDDLFYLWRKDGTIPVEFHRRHIYEIKDYLSEKYKDTSLIFEVDEKEWNLIIKKESFS